MHFGVASTAEKPRQWLVANCVPVPTLPLPAAVIPLSEGVGRDTGGEVRKTLTPPR